VYVRVSSLRLRIRRPTAVTSISRWVEVHRLAVAGGEAAIARDVGNRVGRAWLARSRFADTARLAASTLSLGEDAGALYHLGWARQATGRPTEALNAYQQALRLYQTAGNRGNEAAATLTSIGAVYGGLGQPEQALDYYRQALPTLREVGDRAGEAVTRYNLAMVYRGQRAWDSAVAELEQVVELDRHTHHPDLASDTAMLERVRQEQAESAEQP
jgi:tetratricopeptide (TPR) repeat protein